VTWRGRAHWRRVLHVTGPKTGHSMAAVNLCGYLERIVEIKNKRMK
jgi:hypothetical protein